MENRIGKSDGIEIPKKSRSLDLKTIYKSGVSRNVAEKNLKRKSILGNGTEKRNVNKKSRKEVSSSIASSDTDNNSKESSAEAFHGRLSSGLHVSESSYSDLVPKLECGSSLNGSPLSLNDTVICVPKRKRDFVGRSKYQRSHTSKPEEQSITDVGSVDLVDQFKGDDWRLHDSPKVEQEKECIDFQENRIGKLNPDCKVEDGKDDPLVVSNADLSVKKPVKNHRKSKKLLLDERSIAKKAEILVDKKFNKACEELEDDDEENLEENAARMLSSRFDPNCTRFSSSSRTTVSCSKNRSSFLLPSGRHFTEQGSKSVTRSESASVDRASRVLRPRKQDNEKGRLRKRRHYYEISYGNLDAHWVLNRRIKVFWPLDEIWYNGLVNDYNEERKLHHVKYDDRDEEWINLQTERFKLLLLSSEVPGKTDRRRSACRYGSTDEGMGDSKPSEGKEMRVLGSEDDSYGSSYMDSEPIISWLARSNHRGKSSPLLAIKKQKSSGSPPNSIPLVSGEDVRIQGCTEEVFKRNKNCVFSGSASTESAGDKRKAETTISDNTTHSKVDKPPIVYFRRRFRKRKEALCRASEGSYASTTAAEPFTSFSIVDEFQASEDRDIWVQRLHHSGPFCLVDDAGLLVLTINLIKSQKVFCEFSFPEFLSPNYTFAAENFRLFHAVMLLKYGTVMNVWQQVHLEILCVDNISGLRFFLFEGCLMQAIIFVFRVLTVFNQPANWGKYADLQLPVTSIRFKFSDIHDINKQLVFVLYNFSEVKCSKWIHLDSELKRYCLLSRQLPLSECTFDNVKALQNVSNGILAISPSSECPKIKGKKRRSRHGISCMGASRECTSVTVGQISKFNDMNKKLRPFTLSFTAAPTFFIGLHLQLLMEHNVSHVRLLDNNSLQYQGSTGNRMVVDCTSVEDCCSRTLEIIPGSDLHLSKHATHGLSHCESELEGDGVSAFRNVGRIKSSLELNSSDLGTTGTCANFQSPQKNGSDANLLPESRRGSLLEPESHVLSPKPSTERAKSATWSHSSLSVKIPSLVQMGNSAFEESYSQQSVDLCWNANGGTISSPNPTGPRSMWHRNRTSASSGYSSHGWSDATGVRLHNGFGPGPKKPRTQVSYSSPSGGVVFGSRPRSHLQKGNAHKRVKKSMEKRSSDVSTDSQRNLELMSCEGNVLITHGDKGWREYGAQVTLELFDHNKWKLAVRIAGITKYSYKALQFLQPGSTNRYTHAMMWKGGKDWILEFPDRSQWALFKEMHEECYNRNIHSASRNIPIPGVRLIEETEDNVKEVSFVCNSTTYFRQMETDVEMALNPSRVLYDMDSDDEQWLRIQNSSKSDNTSLGEISEELFEKVMDMFEKIAYAQQRDQITPDEMEHLTIGAGHIQLIRIIYEHWREKRQKKGMPLIRHLQPPLWERYQQQVREWELATTKTSNFVVSGSKEKSAPIEKPPMFAFCLRPRGLEVPNKGSKQRSHKKILATGQGNIVAGDQDGYHGFGRRMYGTTFGDEKATSHGYNYESLDESPLYQISPRTSSIGRFSMFSDGSDRFHSKNLKRSKSARAGIIISADDPKMLASYRQNAMGKRKRFDWQNLGSSEWSNALHYRSLGSQRNSVEELNDPDLREFRLRDASSAAHHAVKVAKLMRERANRLHYRADMAIQRAADALMTAEAFKTAAEDSTGDV